MLTEIDAVYRVATPLFCTGADPEGPPEFRLPSFKGVLRYWWRALAWAEYGARLDVIRQREDRLFGSADGGQSRVSLSLARRSDPPAARVGEVLTVSAANSRVVGDGARYLGYGVMEAFGSRNTGKKAGQLTRSCLRAPFDFTVRMRARDLSEQESAMLSNALTALGIFGGMGAKSRKGYGSLVIRSLLVNGVEQWREPQSMSDLHGEIVKLQRDGGGAAFPEFTALSAKTRHVLLSSGKKEPMELLDHVGREIVRFRSWGRNGKILGGKIDSECNFRDDHDLMKSNRLGKHPRRIAFGLPHNYGPRPDKQTGPSDNEFDRRASPLFIHVHDCGGAPVAVLSFLPARFLPDGRSDISVGGSSVRQKPEEELYRPVHEFLDRLLDRNKRKEPFTDAMEVRL